MTPPQKTLKLVYDPLTELMQYYASRKTEATASAGDILVLEERLQRRIIDGDKIGLQKDLDEALGKYSALQIINDILLAGMKVVGELFGSGQMQLPFVLQSAEVMKSAVAYLEKFMDKATSTSKGTMVIATVKGDVHDIGKNLVDIILTNNGYRVVNLGIKCPIETMLRSVEEHQADALGMSGLLVKSTLIMKENLEVMNERGLTLPVVLGGAALTRRYVEQDLSPVYRGKLAYANDAFDGLHFMEDLYNRRGAEASGAPSKVAPVPATPRIEQQDLTGLEAKIAMSQAETNIKPASKKIAPAAAIPVPPFFGTRAIEAVSLDEIYPFINEAALFKGQWQVRKGKLGEREYAELIEKNVRPDFERLKSEAKEKRLLEPKVVYGYFPCQSEGDDLIIYRWEEGLPVSEILHRLSRRSEEWMRFTFPRQSKDRFLSISDYFAPRGGDRMDVISFTLVTMGQRASEYSHQLFSSNNYKEYLYFHGLSVEAAEALAELWHRRVRMELRIDQADAQKNGVLDIKRLFSQGYQGSRYSFGYPACPSLEDQVKLFELLKPERIGVELTDEYQLVPEQSTDALIVHHPEARYFTM